MTVQPSLGARYNAHRSLCEMNEAGITNSLRTDHGGGHSRIIIVGQLVQILPEGLILTPEDVEVFMESVHHCCEAGTTRAFTPGRRLLHTRRRRHLVVLAACSTPAVLLAVDCHMAASSP